MDPIQLVGKRSRITVSLLENLPKYGPWTVVLIVAVLPLLVDRRYPLHILNVIGIQAILAMSLNLLTGYTGQISIGHAGFYAIGAYSSALLMMRLGLPYPFAAVGAIVIAGVCGAVLSIPVLRVRERHYLAIATLAMGEIVRIAILNAPELTNGPNGLRAIPSPSLFGFDINTVQRTNYFILVLILVVVTFMRRIVASPLGKVFMAIREDESACQAIGVNTTYYKILAFGISSAIAGLAGSVYAHYITYISPDTFTWRGSITFLTMIVIGGLGSLAGSIYGAITLVLVSEYLRAFGSLRFILYGLVLIFVVTFSPSGLDGLVRRFFSWGKVSSQPQTGSLETTSDVRNDST